MFVIRTLTGVNMPELERILRNNGQVDSGILQYVEMVLIENRTSHSLHILHETIAGKDIEVHMKRKSYCVIQKNFETVIHVLVYFCAATLF